MVQLELGTSAVQTPVAHLDEAELHQAPRDLAHDASPRIARRGPPRPGGLQIAVPPCPLARPLAMPRAARRVTLPAPRAALLGVGRVPLPVPRAVSLGVGRVVPPVAGPPARLAAGPTLAGPVIEVELHQVLLLAALRADLGQSMAGTSLARHPQTSRCRWTSMKREDGSGLQVPGSSRSQAPAWERTICEAPASRLSRSRASEIPLRWASFPSTVTTSHAPANVRRFLCNKRPGDGDSSTYGEKSGSGFQVPGSGRTPGKTSSPTPGTRNPEPGTVLRSRRAPLDPSNGNAPLKCAALSL